MRNFLIIILCMLILTNSGLAYNLYHIKIIEEPLITDGSLSICTQKCFGYYIIEPKQQSEYQVRQKDLSTNFNFSTLKSDLKIKSQAIPAIFIKNHIAKIRSQHILRDSLHTFPFNFYY